MVLLANRCARPRVKRKGESNSQGDDRCYAPVISLIGSNPPFSTVSHTPSGLKMQ